VQRHAHAPVPAEGGIGCAVGPEPRDGHVDVVVDGVADDHRPTGVVDRDGVRDRSGLERRRDPIVRERGVEVASGGARNVHAGGDEQERQDDDCAVSHESGEGIAS
jgi:hypothetical protein